VFLVHYFLHPTMTRLAKNRKIAKWPDNFNRVPQAVSAGVLMLIKGMAVGGTGRQRLRRDFQNWKQIFLREKDWTQKSAILRSNRRLKCLQVVLV
jgi:hypothetical protein